MDGRQAGPGDAVGTMLCSDMTACGIAVAVHRRIATDWLEARRIRVGKNIAHGWSLASSRREPSPGEGGGSCMIHKCNLLTYDVSI